MGIINSMHEQNRRISRERKTLVVMIDLYCRRQHSSNALCGGCKELLDYALERLEKCPFQEGKTTCARCPVHCYQPVKRERIRAVMRFSGPLMLFHHPILAILHLIDGRRKFPFRSRS